MYRITVANARHYVYNSQMKKANREITRFVNFVGGNTPASVILGCSPDMVHKLKTGLRPDFKAKYVLAMYRHKGFKLSFLRLFDLAP